MRRYSLSLMAILISLVTYSCKENKVTEMPDKNITIYGESFEPTGEMVYEDFYASIADQDSLDAVVTGTVESVCKVKGCWVNIASTSNPEMESMFVKFKDYGFFLPKDIEGKTITLKGQAYREVTSVDELRHYAEDEGLSEDEINAITEPKQELKFMASGVIMKNDI